MVIDDEAYYAMYARHLSWGYIDHGPVVGWLIKVGTVLCGENGFGTRIIGLLMYGFMSWFLFRFGKSEFNRDTGLILFVTFWINILFHTNGVVTTPDAPLAFFAILAICFYYKAYFIHANYFFPAGVFLGLAFLSKISVFFIALGVFLFPVINAKNRSHLKEYRFYVSFLIAFLIFLPFLIWNYQHNWAFFTYQGSHIARAGTINSFIELWSGTALLLGPVLFYFIVTLSVKYSLFNFKNNAERSSQLFYFGCITIVPLTYFVTHSLFSRFELNWPAPIFYGGIFLFSIHLGENIWKYKKRLFFQWGFSLFLILLITVQTFYPFLPLKGKSDTTNRYFLYTGLLNKLDKYLIRNPDLNQFRISANNYQIPSMVNFYLKPEKEAVCLSIRYHRTLYSFLYPIDLLSGTEMLFIGKGRASPSFLSDYWDNIQFLTDLSSERNGEIIQEYSLWKLSSDVFQR